MRVRIALATAGLLLGFYGVFRIVTQVPHHKLMVLAFWLIGALVIHDGLLSPAVVSISWVLARVVRPRARRYLQFALITGGLVSVIALPMIHRQHQGPVSKALLRQNFSANLTLILAVIAVLTLAAYAVRVARDRTSPAVAAPSSPMPAPSSPDPG
jgi:hypothetical protein